MRAAEKGAVRRSHTPIVDGVDMGRNKIARGVWRNLKPGHWGVVLA